VENSLFFVYLAVYQCFVYPSSNGRLRGNQTGNQHLGNLGNPINKYTQNSHLSHCLQAVGAIYFDDDPDLDDVGTPPPAMQEFTKKKTRSRAGHAGMAVDQVMGGGSYPAHRCNCTTKTRAKGKPDSSCPCPAHLHR
jgi:hypothetical protein